MGVVGRSLPLVVLAHLEGDAVTKLRELSGNPLIQLIQKHSFGRIPGFFHLGVGGHDHSVLGGNRSLVDIDAAVHLSEVGPIARAGDSPRNG